MYILYSEYVCIYSLYKAEFPDRFMPYVLIGRELLSLLLYRLVMCNFEPVAAFMTCLHRHPLI